MWDRGFRRGAYRALRYPSVLGSAVPHGHDLVPGYYSVHTSPDALRDGEAHISSRRPSVSSAHLPDLAVARSRRQGPLRGSKSHSSAKGEWLRRVLGEWGMSPGSNQSSAHTSIDVEGSAESGRRPEQSNRLSSISASRLSGDEKMPVQNTNNWPCFCNFSRAFSLGVNTPDVYIRRAVEPPAGIWSGTRIPSHKTPHPPSSIIEQITASRSRLLEDRLIWRR